MSGMTNVREGMQVYGSDDRLVGTVEELHGDGIHVNGQHIPSAAVARVAQNRVYLKSPSTSLQAQAGTAMGAEMGMARESRAAQTQGTTARAQQDEDHIVVPVVEERLDVDKRAVEVGEVEVRKTVVEEQQSVPVELMREEVHVQQRDIADRPISAANAENLFAGGTIRVPVRGEEAVIEKEAVVTGEVVVDKERVTERQQVTDTVRKERVAVEEHYRRARGDFERHFAQRQGAAPDRGRARTFQEAEPHYRAGFEAAHDERHRGREFEDIEPDLRGSHEASARGAGDSWEHLREEIREGWSRARGR